MNYLYRVQLNISGGIPGDLIKRSAKNIERLINNRDIDVNFYCWKEQISSYVNLAYYGNCKIIKIVTGYKKKLRDLEFEKKEDKNAFLSTPHQLHMISNYSLRGSVQIRLRPDYFIYKNLNIDELAEELMLTTVDIVTDISSITDIFQRNDKFWIITRSMLSEFRCILNEFEETWKVTGDEIVVTSDDLMLGERLLFKKWAKHEENVKKIRTNGRILRKPKDFWIGLLRHWFSKMRNDDAL